MFRKTLALLIRALRVDARLFRPHLMRAGLLAMLLFLVYSLSSEGAMFLGAPGLRLFTAIAWANIWFIILVGVTYFGSAITEEKEEKTLGLLKMADVSGLSLLLGKWLPRVISIVTLLAVQFPFTMLAITLGGLTMRQVVAAYAALFGYLMYVGSVSLFASVVCRTTAAACRLAFIVLVIKGLLPIVLQGMGAASLMNGWTLAGISSERLGEAGAWLNSTTVSWLLERALASTFAESPVPPQLLFLLGESAVFFGLAWALFGPCTKTDLSAEAKPPFWARFVRRRRGTPRRAWQQAIIGKDYRLLAGGSIGTTVRFVIYLVAAFGILMLMAGMFGENLTGEALGYSAISWGLGFLLLEAVLSAARVFRTETHDLTWSSLVMLPRTLTSVAWSKIAGSMLGWWPALALLAIGFLLAPRVLPDFLEAIASEPGALLGVCYFLLQIVLALELTTLYSITLTWAAWPVAAPFAAFTVGICNVVIFTCLATSLQFNNDAFEAFMFLLNCVSVVIIGGLYVAIGRKLAGLAAEGT